MSFILNKTKLKIYKKIAIASFFLISKKDYNKN